MSVFDIRHILRTQPVLHGGRSTSLHGFVAAPGGEGFHPHRAPGRSFLNHPGILAAIAIPAYLGQKKGAAGSERRIRCFANAAIALES